MIATLLEDREKALKLLEKLLAGTNPKWIKSDAQKLLDNIEEREAADNKAAEGKWKAKQERAKRGRKNSGKFEIAPQLELGVDHSASGIVLLKNARGDRLVWRSGGSYWSGIGMQGYGKAALEILYNPLSGKGRSTSLEAEDLKEGRSRLSKKKILANAERIDAEFGPGSAAKVAELKGTVTV